MTRSRLATVLLAVLLVGVPAPTQAATVTLIGAGDIATCGTTRDSATAQLVGGIRGTVFTIGDNAYPNGTLSDFARCYGPTWGRFKNRTRPSPGNHDYHVAGAGGYFAYFGSRAGPAGRGYYAYNLGAWRIYSLNSNVIGSAQVSWLKADLAANPTTCVAAYWHHARFSSGFHGNDSRVKPFWDALYAAGAELILNAHDHDYERFGPQTPGGRLAPAFGMREVVVGTGGAGQRPFFHVQPYSRVRMTNRFGAIVLRLNVNGYTAQFRTVGGTVRDSFGGTCHGRP
jgi:acid phosphatase type 7